MPSGIEAAVGAVRSRFPSRRAVVRGASRARNAVRSLETASAGAGIRVLVVDDHPLVRQGLRDSIGREPTCWFVAKRRTARGRWRRRPYANPTW